jgi:hypothetical protein
MDTNRKKERRTYGVRLMEWQALIPAGYGVVKVHFKGGSYSGYGQTPATFTTDNVALQRLIEDSSYFDSGKIFRMR